MAPYDPAIETRGEGPAVVLVPGMDGTGRLFYRQTPLLARSFRVTTYALRDDATSMDVLVEDLASAIRSVSPARRAIVIGESFGGALSLSLALRHPEQVDALVIINSFPYFGPQFRLRVAIYGLGVLPWGAMAVVRRLTAARMHSPHTHRDEIARFLDLTKAATKRGYIGRLRILERYDVRDRLADIDCPTLFVAADADHLVPSLEQARFMSARVPGSTVKVLEGHGHICLIAPEVDLALMLASWRP